MVEIANKNAHLKVMAGFSRRFDASYRNAKAQVTEDAIGEPFVIRSQTCDLIDNTGFFVRYAAKNGGMFVDLPRPLTPVLPKPRFLIAFDISTLHIAHSHFAQCIRTLHLTFSITLGIRNTVFN